jgi:hypothetical protein
VNDHVSLQAVVWPHFGRMHIGLTIDNRWDPPNCVTFVMVPGSPFPERMLKESPCGGMCPIAQPHVHIDTDYWRFDMDKMAWIAPDPPDHLIRHPSGWFARTMN